MRRIAFSTHAGASRTVVGIVAAAMLAMACSERLVPGECHGPTDCPLDEGCRDGRCYVTCRADSDCLGQTICEEGLCVPGHVGASDPGPIGGGDQSMPGDGANPSDGGGGDGNGDGPTNGDGGDGDDGGGDGGDNTPTGGDTNPYVATWQPVYPASWTCTAAGADGCCKEALDFIPATFKPDPPDAPLPGQLPEICTTGYVATWSVTYPSLWTCTAVGATGCYKDPTTTTALTFDDTGPDVPAPGRAYTTGYIASWSASYPSAWTCTGVGATGCYRDPTSTTALTFDDTGPDASAPGRTYTTGYIAGFSYGSFGACSASCGGGTQTRTATANAWDETGPDATASTSQSCNSHSCTCRCEDLVDELGTRAFYRLSTLLCDNDYDPPDDGTADCGPRRAAGAIQDAHCPGFPNDDVSGLTDAYCCRCP